VATVSPPLGMEDMPLGDAQLVLHTIELGHTPEGEGASWSGNRLLEHRFPALASDCRIPFADIQNEDPAGTEHCRQREKDLLPTRRVQQVVEDPTAQNAIVVCGKR
jgi:hypothetical protein